MTAATTAATATTTNTHGLLWRIRRAPAPINKATDLRLYIAAVKDARASLVSISSRLRDVQKEMIAQARANSPYRGTLRCECREEGCTGWCFLSPEYGEDKQAVEMSAAIARFCRGLDKQTSALGRKINRAQKVLRLLETRFPSLRWTGEERAA
jgi:hypothetical protein